MAEPMIFIDGLRVEKPGEKAPTFVKAKITVKVANLVAFLEKWKNKEGWLDIDVLESKKGSYYAKLSTYGRKDLEEKFAAEPQQGQAPMQTQDGPPMDIIQEDKPY